MLLAKVKMAFVLVMSICVGLVSAEIIGNQSVGSSSSTTAKRSGQRFEVMESGNITSVTIYHSGTGNQLIVAVYADNSGKPGALIGRSSIHSANTSAGWQTVALDAAAPITQGAYVWLAWFFQNAPGTRYVSGSGCRYHNETWPSGATPEVLMPSSFGSSSSLSRSYSVYADYTPSGGTTYTLTTNVSPSSSGTITRNPDKSSYNDGEQVTLTANPASGYDFANWSGDAGGISNPTVVTMNANKSVTANFTAQTSAPPPNNWTSNPGTGVTWTNDQVGVGTDQVPAGTMLRVNGAAQANELHAPIMTCTDNTHILPDWGGIVQLNGGGANRTWRNDNFQGRVRWYNSDNGWNDVRASLTNNGDFDGVALNGRGVFAVAATVTNGVYPVTAFGALTTNANNRDQFQAALDAARDAGGATVLIPPGQWSIGGELVIHPGVTLQGAWNGPHDAILERGTTIRVTNTSSNEEGTPFITMGGSSALRGVTIYYEHQVDPAAPDPFPWTIRFEHSLNPWPFPWLNGVDCVIENVTLANSWGGIDLHNHHERHYLHNVNIGALRLGVFIDSCTDVGRMINVHIHPRFWWHPGNFDNAQILQLREHSFDHLIGFYLRRSDWEYDVNCFVSNANTGWFFDGDPVPDPYFTPSVCLTQSGSDNCRLAALINRSRFNAGISGTNCDWAGQFVIAETNEGMIRMVNSRFCYNWDEHPNFQNTNLIVLYGGTGTLSLTNCFFSEWDPDGGHNSFALWVVHGVALLNNCDFISPRPTIYLANPDANCKAVGCRFRGGISAGTGFLERVACIDH